MKKIITLSFAFAILLACKEEKKQILPKDVRIDDPGLSDVYMPVKLTADLSGLTESQKQMIPFLIKAADVMDTLFWMEAWPGYDSGMMDTLPLNKQEFMKINYGPWDRLNDNLPFIDGVERKPSGANFYPIDMSRPEFERYEDDCKTSQYTLIRRDDEGALTCVWYHDAFAEYVNRAANYLDKAADLAEEASLKKYLRLRAEALRTDNYTASDIAWLQMDDNVLDIIIGPIENYEDQKYGYKAAHEAYVLIKDVEWSNKLKRFAGYLPMLQDSLPVPDKYKTEKPGGNAQLNAYDVVYYAGDCNAGSKTIAVNLPNDEELQINYGTRRSQLKNAMRAKFDEILVPISEVLIAEDQLDHITFDAFFENTMFHEVAHGLGIKNTVNGMGSVREALLEQHSALEEGKADILGLYMVTQLHKMGALGEKDLRDNYVTFMASIFRSVRFGASSAHGLANMMRFNYFMEKGAFTRNKETGRYSVNFEAMEIAMNDLTNLILRLQGDGDYVAVKALFEEKGKVGPQLKSDLIRAGNAGVPVDVVFEQGLEVLGLKE